MLNAKTNNYLQACHMKWREFGIQVTDISRLHLVVVDAVVRTSEFILDKSADCADVASGDRITQFFSSRHR